MPTRPARILCVDDDETILRLLELILQNACYEVLIAVDGETACACVSEKHPDLVLLDVNLPGMDGFETCRRIMACDSSPKPAVIFLSGDGDPGMIAKGLHLGAADFLQKPVAAAELLLRVGNHVHIRDQDALLRRHSLELESLVEERTQALIHADRLASLGTLAAGTAHEINNPTAVIRGNLDTLRMYWKAVAPVLDSHVMVEQDSRIGVVLEEMPKLLDGMTRATSRIAEIVSGLLRFGARRQGEKVSVDVVVLLAEELDLTRNKLKYGVTVTQDIGVSPLVLGNPTELSQVFANLLTNAADAIGENTQGTIRISTWISDEKLAIALDDDGPGIPEKLKTRITQPFFTTKPVGKGTGLGLPICIGIIEDHGGSLRLENRAEGGCRAIVELPLHSDQQHAEPDRDDRTTFKKNPSSKFTDAKITVSSAE